MGDGRRLALLDRCQLRCCRLDRLAVGRRELPDALAAERIDRAQCLGHRRPRRDQRAERAFVGALLVLLAGVLVILSTWVFPWVDSIVNNQEATVGSP